MRPEDPTGNGDQESWRSSPHLRRCEATQEQGYVEPEEEEQGE